MWWGSLPLTFMILNQRVIMGSSGMQILNKILTLKCHTCPGKQPQCYREQLYLEWAELLSLWIFQANWLPWQWDDAHWALCHNCLSVRWELNIGQRVVRSNPHTSRVGRWVTWGVVSRYVDIHLKTVPSDGLYIWMKNIISISTLMTTSLISLLM